MKKGGDNKLHQAKINGVSCLFTEDRKETPQVPGYPFRYELRHGDDDWSRPVNIEVGVFVNFYGVVYSPVPLLKEGEEYRRVRGFKIAT